MSFYYLVNDADLRRIKRRAMRTSAHDGLLGARFNPLVLKGPPGIGKSYRARRLAHHLAVPMTMIDATSESLQNLTPADVHFGRGETILRQRESIKQKTIETRRLLHRKSAA